MPHIHNQIDFTSEVFVVYKNTVLLRKHDKFGIWLSVGGHIELHEDPNEAAVREVKEEVGLEVQLYHEGLSIEELAGNVGYRELVSPQGMNRHNVSPTHEHVTLVYFARANTDTLVLSQTEKSEGCKWFTKAELSEAQYAIRSSIQRYANMALDKFGDK